MGSQDTRSGEPPTEVMLVDDTMGNVESARRAGWSALLADADGHWVDDVDRWIERARQSDSR